ncbi:hypothetical protein ATSB10_08350 [Dyella thiooxydans]|uniref:Uncharacterized protein n=1 Tax=Dyella thiooxydans TaxID=445710 RepID=A0A161IV21_9GAMM|nr:hypothetical protein ATSB10_08350 [Dyella thiooxydans]
MPPGWRHEPGIIAWNAPFPPPPGPVWTPGCPWTTCPSAR